ncbi:hypothetical protein MARCHEWKA_01770 [Brevundimonas phage vB_BpoS-Marchewka]|uniref:Uncharacterized protein n=1 Tax=Brevundimonas phage vB_BpoS-Marchewka TaxID=2948604 RepID=A0A9E7N4D7_9CAUD|nr:hypothetical protein MARCHEWKA_01770 [Brevundimonas phage vB_BpoS-Marchewka]UTC29136.1 hypothetical protein BAMBUS_00530 [Brevundimonas phage vB_BpoS-Bambus]
MTAVKVNRPAPSPVQVLTPPLRVLNKAFDEFDADYDPTDEYAEIAHKVRAEESAW